MSRKNSLDHVHLTGYKSIQNMDLSLRSLNILIGANGAGKTNFISLFTLLRNMMDSNLGLYVIHSIKSWRVYHFHDTSPSAKVKQTGDLNDNLSLRAAAGNLAAFLYRLQETEPQS